MSRIGRFCELAQPTLPLGHGPVRWDTLPPPVRERVLTLWTQLLTEHLSHVATYLPDGVRLPALPAPDAEEGP